jgi:hypothetical protein
VCYSQVSGVETRALTALEMARGLKSADNAASTSSREPGESKELVSER